MLVVIKDLERANKQTNLERTSEFTDETWTIEKTNEPTTERTNE